METCKYRCKKSNRDHHICGSTTGATGQRHDTWPEQARNKGKKEIPPRMQGGHRAIRRAPPLDTMNPPGQRAKAVTMCLDKHGTRETLEIPPKLYGEHRCRGQDPQRVSTHTHNMEVFERDMHTCEYRCRNANRDRPPCVTDGSWSFSYGIFAIHFSTGSSRSKSHTRNSNMQVSSSRNAKRKPCEMYARLKHITKIA